MFSILGGGQTVRDLLFQIIARPPIRDIDAPYTRDIPPINVKGENIQIGQYLVDAGMLSDREIYSPSWHKVKIEPKIRMQLDSFFAYPVASRSPFPNSIPLNIALRRLEKQQKQDREILNRLQAGRVFEEIIGESRRCDEVLLHLVGKLALVGKELVAIFDNVQIGKTKAGAKVAASVGINNGVFELSITGRPESMPDEPMKQLISAYLNPFLPRLGQEQSNFTFSEERVEELIDIVTRIMSVNSI